ncbi:heparan-alpha-glucosaminide N-acetyltransferase domain-containing protein [Kineococcus glutinatus]|uniref:Heparan-alpha-glucosaminide N-acetyltransferase catalytic domain-containing protein n=1 Tax=Kineococcus glutinatus TaxID=1070872 RepID=A0ABP9IAP6_9ACTN
MAAEDVQQRTGGTTSPAAPGRITSLDWVRGWLLVVSVAVNSLWAAPAWFGHAPWAGVHPVDLVFPVFATLSGCGLGFALRRRVAASPLVRRVLVLLVAGLLYNAVTSGRWDVGTWRLTGVLQLYAVVVVALSLGHLLTRTWRGWALLTACLAAAHTALLSAWGAGCPGGELTAGCNPSGAVDPALLGAAHVYGQGALGHDPEGVVAVAGALVSAAAGATVAHLLLRLRGAPGRGPPLLVLLVLALAAGLLGVGVLAGSLPPLLGGADVPAMKRLWTAPFALPVAAGVALALLAGHVLLDRPATGAVLRGASWPLVALGRNSLLVYFGSHVLTAVLGRADAADPAAPAPDERAGAALAGALGLGEHPQVVWTVALVVAWTALACVLHARRLYLRP